MNRSRSKFINFIKICNAALCLFQIATSIIQKFLTDWFNVFAYITSLCQWCTINLSKWNIQEIRQSLEFWLENGLVFHRTNLYNVSLARTSGTKDKNIRFFQIEIFNLFIVTFTWWLFWKYFSYKIQDQTGRALGRDYMLTGWCFITPISTRWQITRIRLKSCFRRYYPKTPTESGHGRPAVELGQKTYLNRLSSVMNISLLFLFCFWFSHWIMIYSFVVIITCNWQNFFRMFLTNNISIQI